MAASNQWLQEMGDGEVDQKAFGSLVYGCGAAGSNELQTTRTIHDISLGGVGHDDREATAGVRIA